MEDYNKLQVEYMSAPGSTEDMRLMYMLLRRLDRLVDELESISGAINRIDDNLGAVVDDKGCRLMVGGSVVAEVR